MIHLLREYVRKILSEAKIKDVDVIPGQILSIVAEHAVIQGLGGGSTFESAMSDKLVAPYFEQLASLGVNRKEINSYKTLMNTIYNDCAMLVEASKSELGFEVVEVTGGNVGSTTAKVDVIVAGSLNQEPISADVHVKFNDFARLIGLQADAPAAEESAAKKVVLNAARLAGELDESWPAAAKYKFLRNRFITASKDEGGVGYTPKGDVTKQSAIKQYGAKNELKILQDPSLRKKFLDYLRANDLPSQILEEVQAFFSATGKAVYFYKFGTKPEAVNIQAYELGDGPQVELHVDKVVAQGKSLTIVENIEQRYGSTCLYILQYAKKDVFFVEARTSGEGHPMQIKMVPGADYGSIFINSEYEVVIA